MRSRAPNEYMYRRTVDPLAGTQDEEIPSKLNSTLHPKSVGSPPLLVLESYETMIYDPSFENIAWVTFGAGGGTSRLMIFICREFR